MQEKMIAAMIVTGADGVIDIPLTANKLDDVFEIDKVIVIVQDKGTDEVKGEGTKSERPGERPGEHPCEHNKEIKKIRELSKVKEINKEKISALPMSIKDDVMQFIIRDAIIYLNIKSNKKYHLLSTAAGNFIPERIRAGYSINDIHMLIDYYVKEWVEGRATTDVINPERLFRQKAIDNMINPEEAEGDEIAKEKRAREIELIKQVLDYLNKKTHRVGKYAYLYITPEYQKQILARYAEGYKTDDLKRVVDVKVSEWLGDRKMEVFLRPTTLFGPKFKEYVMQTPLKIHRYRQMAQGQKLSKTKKDSDFGKDDQK